MNPNIIDIIIVFFITASNKYRIYINLVNLYVGDYASYILMSDAQISIDGYPVNASQYTVGKKAKYFLYFIPQSDLDVIAPMGAFNRTHSLQLTAIDNTDAESLIDLLQNNIHTLIDIEGISHTVSVQSVKNELVGGKGGANNVYDFTIVFVENNA